MIDKTNEKFTWEDSVRIRKEWERVENLRKARQVALQAYIDLPVGSYSYDHRVAAEKALKEYNAACAELMAFDGAQQGKMTDTTEKTTEPPKPEKTTEPPVAGDLVQLKSGGPIMTVDFVDNDSKKAHVIWQKKGGEIERDKIGYAALIVGKSPSA